MIDPLIGLAIVLFLVAALCGAAFMIYSEE